MSDPGPTKRVRRSRGRAPLGPMRYGLRIPLGFAHGPVRAGGVPISHENCNAAGYSRMVDVFAEDGLLS